MTVQLRELSKVAFKIRENIGKVSAQNKSGLPKDFSDFYRENLVNV